MMVTATAVRVLNGSWPEPTNTPLPGSPAAWKGTAHWFSTQLVLSLSIGVSAFLLFCFLRTRWELVYMPRTKLKDFSPAPAHWPDQKARGMSRFFGWIIPTLRTSEFVVLQTVGLDAAVLLSFFRMAFLLFSMFAALAAVILMPIYKLRGGTTDSPSENIPPENETFALLSPHMTWPVNGSEPISWFDVLVDPETSAALQLLFAYGFTAITLYFLHRNYHRFVTARQAFGLQLLHSVSARTVLVTCVPAHLRGDRALAEYFEGCGWEVESVSIVRHVEAVKRALDRRTEALLQLESAWVAWVGNPAKAESYEPDIYQNSRKAAPAEGTGEDSGTAGELPPSASGTDPESLRERYGNIHSDRPRPTKRISLTRTVDAIQYWEDAFFDADQEVRTLRKTGRFEPTHVAFVTFEDVKSAQAACQVVHYREHSRVITNMAPEPRDVIWSKLGISARQGAIRDVVVMGLTVALLTGWIPPVAALASLLSYDKNRMPWLTKLIDRYPVLEPIIKNSLPSLALILFNSLLPFVLEMLCYQQGFKSRSAAEYSLTRKHYVFLVFSVLFIVQVSTTYWALARELADAPMKIPEKLAVSLQTMNLRHFMVSYVMLQGMGLMPLQLLNLGPLFTLTLARLRARTPRDFAEANAPPLLNYGWVYPNALLIFTITITYSIVSPLVLVFGAIYFGMAYLVYKYKLLFIYFKPFESNGEAWKITFDRLVWSLVLFQVFVTGLFSLRKSFWLTGLMLPLVIYTTWWGWVMSRDFTPLSKYLALSNICDVQRGEQPAELLDMSGDDQLPQSLVGLNHKRYAMNDDTLYVSPADKRTDYSQPPMNSFYYGVLNTGRKRYGHPALTGVLPKPWLPSKYRPPAFGDTAASRRGVVLSLRRKVAKKLRRSHASTPSIPTVAGDDRSRRDISAGTFGPSGSGTWDDTPTESSRLLPNFGGGGGMTSSTYSNSTINSNPWARESTESTVAPDYGLPRRLSLDESETRAFSLGDEHVWDNDADDDDDDDDDSPEQEDEAPASPSTYFHRPHRRRTISSVSTLPGAA